jgi:hypothetical protein
VGKATSSMLVPNILFSQNYTQKIFLNAFVKEDGNEKYIYSLTWGVKESSRLGKEGRYFSKTNNYFTSITL